MCERIEQPLSLEGWVEKHGAKPKQWLVGGTPNYLAPAKSKLRGRKVTKEIILDRCALNPKTGCWIWMGRVNYQGYGKIKENGKTIRVHRRAYELWVAEVPVGMCVLHNCPGGDNPSCCNPDHLRCGTKRDNLMDRLQKGKSGKVGFVL